MTPRRPLGLRAIAALVLLFVFVRPAHALPPSSGDQPTPAPAAPPALAEPPPVAITVNGVCPNAEAIWAAVASIVPAKDLDRFAAAAKVDVSDLGDSYRVSVNAKGIDRLRVYRDLAHDCDHRARFAAVFVVLTLMPPDVLFDALPAQPHRHRPHLRHRPSKPFRGRRSPSRRPSPGRASRSPASATWRPRSSTRRGRSPSGASCGWRCTPTGWR